jgi:hypothetical protein
MDLYGCPRDRLDVARACAVAADLPTILGPNSADRAARLAQPLEELHWLRRIAGATRCLKKLLRLLKRGREYFTPPGVFER